MHYAIAMDRHARTQSLTRHRSIPYVIFIDPKGFVRWEGHPDHLKDRVIDQLLKDYGS